MTKQKIAINSNSRKKGLESDNRWGGDVWNDWNAIGNAVMYLATPDDNEGYVGGYTIDWDSEVPRKDLRGYREEKRRSGRKVCQIPKTQLIRGLLVIFGTETSPAEAVASLKRLAAEIQKNGMLIGKRKNGNYMVETVAGEIV